MSQPPLSHELPAAALRVLSRSRRVETVHGETRIAWRVWGEEKDEPLVLLHGGSGSWTHWLRNVEPLAATGRRVIVPDLPGFGDSVAARGVTDVDGMVEPMAAGLHEVVGTEGFDLAGFSFGGMLGGLIAAARPALIRHLVIAGAPALGFRAKDLGLKEWRHLEDTEARNAVHRHNLGVLLIHDPENIDDLTVQLHAANMARDRMRRRRIARTDILAQTLPLLQCKVDGIWGECDQLYVGLMGELQALLQRLPNFGELVLVEGAGHWVQYERPETFNRALATLLASH